MGIKYGEIHDQMGSNKGLSNGHILTRTLYVGESNSKPGSTNEGSLHLGTQCIRFERL